MIVAYIAGPYRDKRGAHFVQENINKAREVAAEVWKQGMVPLCPHLNSAHFDGLVDEDVFLQGTKNLLSRCDMIVLVPGWERSEGTLEELRFNFKDMKSPLPVTVYPDVNKVVTKDRLTALRELERQ